MGRICKNSDPNIDLYKLAYLRKSGTNPTNSKFTTTYVHARVVVGYSIFQSR
jgi:hypothetical protein